MHLIHVSVNTMELFGKNMVLRYIGLHEFISIPMYCHRNSFHFISLNHSIEQGTIFIVRRAESKKGQSSEYLLIVLNKAGMDNLVLDMANCKRAKIQADYIMMQCNTGTGRITFG